MTARTPNRISEPSHRSSDWKVVRRVRNGRGVEVARFDSMSKAVKEAMARDEGRDWDDPYHEVRPVKENA